MLIVGLISGTSADGIDTVLCDISGEPPVLSAKIVRGFTYLYDPGLRQRILDTFSPDTGHVDEVTRLNADIAEAFAAATLALIREAGLTPGEVDLIGSHGQTVWHEVRADGSAYATLQLGEGAILAERTGITTISNFRPRDIAVGGQGAPLTAYADWLLLRHATVWRAVQNIGGIGNVTFLPPLADEKSAPLAFDTGPGNALLDSTMTLLTGGAYTYDADGRMARSGNVQEDWLDTLLKHPYYERRPPKTTGRELFSKTMAQQLIVEGQQRGYGVADIVATLTALTAASIADAYERFQPARIGEVILGGGGAHNKAMIDLLSGLVSPATVLTHEDIGLDSDFKEGLVFALLAHETIHNRPGNLPSLTGAGKRVVLGQITPGDNYHELVRRTLCSS
ncbi:MAG: anhydro-N-acetylmuramic acid kinase [Chloroflexota bacterium]